MTRRALRVGLLMAALVVPTSGWGDVAPGGLAVIDAFADPFTTGDFGALFEAQPLDPPEANATALSSSPLFYTISDLAFAQDRSIVIVDRDADPSGIGADANGDHGPGAVFIAAAADGAISLLADGADYPAGLPPATRTIFVDPRGVAVTAAGAILVTDTDADPSQLGIDGAGFAGHGALFSVGPSGSVTLVADGALSSDGPPPAGAASWFEDPGAVLVARDGRVHVLDLYADPLGVGGRGAIFLVDLATGTVRLEGVSPFFRAPTGLAELADGSLVVTDSLADLRGDGSRGALLKVDLAAASPDTAVSVLTTDARFRGPAGIGAAPDGSVFFADPFADPLSLGRLGAVFRRMPDGSVRVASSTSAYVALASVRVSPPLDLAPSLDSVTPSSAEAASSLTVTLAGSAFTANPELAFGVGVSVTAVRFISDTSVEADLNLDAAAVLGPRDVTLTNRDLQASTLIAGFTVLARASPQVDACVPNSAVQATSVSVRVTGARFATGATASFGSGVTVNSTTVVDSATLDADITVQPAALAGPRDVVVMNPDSTSGTLMGGFTVLLPAPPQPITVTPSMLGPGEGSELIIDGTGFTPGVVFDFGSGLLAGPATVESPTRARLLVHVDSTAAAGPRDVTARALDGATGLLVAGFNVSAAPALRVTRVVIDDSMGNANNALDPGEQVALDVTIWNAGTASATGLAIRIVDPSPGLGLVILRATVTFPDASPLATTRRAGPPLPELSVLADVPCGMALPLDVEILSSGQVVARRRIELPIGRVASWGRKPDVDGDATGGARGTALALADVDGDGVADLIVGAPRESPASMFAAGRVTVVSGASDDVLWTLDGEEVNGRLGSAVATVGDVDGDGLKDLLVGAPGEASDAGRVRVVSGANGSELGALVGSAGSRLGTALALLGDRDLDGNPDALIGAPAAAAGAGRALVATLPSLVEIARLDGAVGDALGTALVALGDVDDDGRADGAVGAPGAGAGRVVQWNATDTVLSLPGVDPGEAFGSALASGVDVDADGVADLLVGAPAASLVGGLLTGRVDVVSSRAGAFVRRWFGDAAGDELGRAVAFVHDADGDGIADAMLGAPGAASGDGLLELRSPGSGRLITFFDVPAGSGGRMGESLAGARDVGGDAFADALVGSPRRSFPSLPFAGRATAFKTVASCTPVFACTPDAAEPNDPPSDPPTFMDYGTRVDLTICRGDVDAFTLSPPPGRRMVAVVSFIHAAGDLDARAYDASGALVDSSLSQDDDEELGPFGPGGTFTLQVYGFSGATNGYSLMVLDPDSCPPLEEIAALRVAKAGAGRVVVTWQPSSDACHAQPPATGYRVWSAPTPRPSGPVTFPSGTSFVDATATDLDGDATDARFVDGAPGTLFYLVNDIGLAGEDGPLGAY